MMLFISWIYVLITPIFMENNSFHSQEIYLQQLGLAESGKENNTLQGTVWILKPANA